MRINDKNGNSESDRGEERKRKRGKKGKTHGEKW